MNMVNLPDFLQCFLDLPVHSDLLDHIDHQELPDSPDHQDHQDFRNLSISNVLIFRCTWGTRIVNLASLFIWTFSDQITNQQYKGCVIPTSNVPLSAKSKKFKTRNFSFRKDFTKPDSENCFLEIICARAIITNETEDSTWYRAFETHRLLWYEFCIWDDWPSDVSKFDKNNINKLVKIQDS